MTSPASAFGNARTAPRLHARTTRPTATEVATMLDTLATADRELAAALDAIAGSRARVSRGTVAALERLLATLRPAADARARLVHVDWHVLAAAIRLRRAHYDTAPTPAEEGTDDQR